MGSRRAAAGLVSGILLLLLTTPTSPAGAQAAQEASRPQKSVYGTLEKADQSLNGVFMRSKDGERLAWRFPAAVVSEVAHFKPGDPMIVIYRQISSSDKRVTAVAFPGSAETPVYVNLTGSRILLRAAPFSNGVCGAGVGPVTDRMIANGAQGDALGDCWCCAPDDGSCVPGNKTGLGRALLVSCFE